MRRIATPFSSVEKSNPRWNDRSPVDMSVRLAVLKSRDCLGCSEITLFEGVVLLEDGVCTKALRVP